MILAALFWVCLVAAAQPAWAGKVSPAEAVMVADVPKIQMAQYLIR